MSRSNPTSNQAHPASRWFEWDGENGRVRYFDKEATGMKDGKEVKGANVDVPIPWAFLTLEETSSVRGWNESAGSGIFSNEVKDTRDQPMLVKMFNGKEIANGLYSQIRDTVVARGGHFNSNIYLLFKNGEGKPDLGVLQLKGAALSAWMDFRKKAGKALWDKAVVIKDKLYGKKGKIEFFTPVFDLKDVSAETNASALKLDSEVVQPYLTEYFARGASKAAAAPAQPSAFLTEDGLDKDDVKPPGKDEADDTQSFREPIEDDSLPF